MKKILSNISSYAVTNAIISVSPVTQIKQTSPFFQSTFPHLGLEEDVSPSRTTWLDRPELTAGALYLSRMDRASTRLATSWGSSIREMELSEM